MSDIYLQITETPTVVTLSAPVVSGALASTVTVANTVTVALDANSLNALENVTVTVGAAVSISNFPATQTIAGTVTANPTGTQTIAGTVTANVSSQDLYGQQATTSGSFLRSALYYEDLLAGAGEFLRVNNDNDGGLPIRTVGTDLVNVSGTVTANINTFPDATTIGEQIAQGFTNYGSFDVGISGTANVSGTVTLGASTSQIGSVTASISNSVVTFYPMQGTSVSNTNFTSTTASTTLVSAVAGREVLTVFNEGAGNLHISPGATCTTISYQVRLSAGDYWECPQGQLSLAHTAVFSATGSTARVTQVS